MFRFGKKQKYVFVNVDYPEKCPKGHSDIEQLDYETIDIIETEKQADYKTGRIRNVELHSAVCRIWCNRCQKEYEVDCTVTKYTGWRYPQRKEQIERFPREVRYV